MCSSLRHYCHIIIYVKVFMAFSVMTCCIRWKIYFFFLPLIFLFCSFTRLNIQFLGNERATVNSKWTRFEYNIVIGFRKEKKKVKKKWEKNLEKYACTVTRSINEHAQVTSGVQRFRIYILVVVIFFFFREESNFSSCPLKKNDEEDRHDLKSNSLNW